MKERQVSSNRPDLVRHTNGRKGQESQPRRIPVAEDGKDPSPYWPGLSHPSAGCEAIAGIFYPTTISYDFEDHAQKATFGNVKVTISGANCTVSGKGIFDAAWEYGMRQRHEEKWQQAMAYKRAHPSEFPQDPIVSWKEAQDNEYHPWSLESMLEAGIPANGKVESPDRFSHEYLRGHRIKKQSRMSETMTELGRLMESIGAKERAGRSKGWAFVQRTYEAAINGTLPVSRAVTKINHFLDMQKGSQRYAGSVEPTVSEHNSADPEYVTSLVQRLAQNTFSAEERSLAVQALRSQYGREGLFQIYLSVQEQKTGSPFTAEEIRYERQRFGLDSGYNKELTPVIVKNPKQSKIRPETGEDIKNNPALLWRVFNEGREVVSEMYGVSFDVPHENEGPRQLTEIAGFNGGKTGNVAAVGPNYRDKPSDSEHYIEHFMTQRLERA